MTTFKNAAVIVLGLGLSSALGWACSSSNSNATPPVYGNDAGDATTPSNDASPSPEDASADAATSNPDSSNAGDAAGDAAAEGGDSGAPTCTSVLSDAGCWTCPGASAGSVEFLNQCAGAGVHCFAFDSSRLPGIDGGRPPLN